MRTLYHGSWTVVDRPEAARGRRNLDFGRGFYLTELRSQAERWARLVAERKARDGTARLNVYRFDDDAARRFRCLRFGKYDLAWLDFVVACRAAGAGPVSSKNCTFMNFVCLTMKYKWFLFAND